MSQTIHFNTRRLYTEHGQRITATLHDDGVVTFWDHDRQVDGEFALPLHCRLNSIEVMHWYDSGQYTHSSRSWQDGMLRGGCNAHFTKETA